MSLETGNCILISSFFAFTQRGAKIYSMNGSPLELPTATAARLEQLQRFLGTSQAEALDYALQTAFETLERQSVTALDSSYAVIKQKRDGLFARLAHQDDKV